MGSIKKCIPQHNAVKHAYISNSLIAAQLFGPGKNPMFRMCFMCTDVCLNQLC